MRKLAIRIALLALLLLGVGRIASAQVVIQVGFAPPPLPVYAQPICPGDGYMWTPGYWAWDPDGGDYFWVPGTWILAPQVGYFWTPGWWGWGNGFYIWHGGYWGPHIGFYGGINYGFGYFGNGFVGGRWDGGHFFYNREVTNVNVTVIRNVYNERINVREESHVSFNGGHGGIDARPTHEEEAYDRAHHVEPVAAQVEHRDMARSTQQLRASYNHGKPPIAATARPGNFNEHEPAREAGGTWNPPAKGEAGRGEPSRGSVNATHARELPPLERQPAPNTGNAAQDKKYQQEQDKLYNKQTQERQKLQQQQQKEDQRMQQPRASQERTQQMEQRHQQQTQQMSERHTQQQQQMQQRQAPPTSHGGGEKPR